MGRYQRWLLEASDPCTERTGQKGALPWAGQLLDAPEVLEPWPLVTPGADRTTLSGAPGRRGGVT